MPLPAFMAWAANNPAVMALIQRVGGNLIEAKQKQKKKKPTIAQQGVKDLDINNLLEVMKNYKGGA
jgi:hypothetical protein